MEAPCLWLLKDHPLEDGKERETQFQTQQVPAMAQLFQSDQLVTVD